jgi:hypothetical protein
MYLFGIMEDLQDMCFPKYVLISMALVLCTAGCENSNESSNESVALVGESSRNQIASNSGFVEGIEKLAVGDMAPNFRVEVLGGKFLDFHDFLDEASGPTLLLFDRAHW